MNKDKIKQIVLFIFELTLALTILFVSIFTEKDFTIKTLDSILSIGLTFTFGFNFKINMTFIKKADEILINNANKVNIQQSDLTKIENAEKIETGKILLGNQKSNDEIIIGELKKYLEDFAISYKSGIIGIMGAFKNEDFDCIHNLKYYLVSSTCTFKNEKLEELKNSLKENVCIFLNRLALKSFPISGSLNLNIFRYFELDDEKMYDPKSIKDEELQITKKDLDEAQEALDNIVKYYDDIIKFSVKNL